MFPWWCISLGWAAVSQQQINQIRRQPSNPQTPDSVITHQQAVKTQIYSTLLLRVIQEATGGGISPHFFFEKTDKDGWAKRQFSGMQLTLMWPFVSNGVPVPAPQFVSPQHDPFLELADFVSFVIARYLYIVAERHSGKAIDFDLNPSCLGEIRYQGFQADGLTLASKQVGYPLELFFAGTDWEHQC